MMDAFSASPGSNKQESPKSWGTDIFNDPVHIEDEIKWLDRLTVWHSPGDIVIMATGNAGELLKLSGIRDPCPGDLGVVKEGALSRPTVLHRCRLEPSMLALIPQHTLRLLRLRQSVASTH